MNSSAESSSFRERENSEEEMEAPKTCPQVKKSSPRLVLRCKILEKRDKCSTPWKLGKVIPDFHKKCTKNCKVLTDGSRYKIR